MISFIKAIKELTHSLTSWSFMKTLKMKEAKAKKMITGLNINSLPPELMEKILIPLTVKEIYNAQLICRKWKDIIDKCNLLKKASGNIFETYEKVHFAHVYCLYLEIPITFHFRESFCHNCCQTFYPWSHNWRFWNQTTYKSTWTKLSPINLSLRWSHNDMRRLLLWPKVSQIGTWYLEGF